MTGERSVKLKVGEGGRLDKALAAACAEEPNLAGLGLSRARLQQLMKEGCLRAAGGQVIRDPSQKTKGGEAFELFLPEPEAARPEAEYMPLSILYEDDDLLVLNKPAGLVVHPAAGHRAHTLVNALLAHCGGSLSGIGGVVRPGIVHRLDKETSGLLVVAKNDFAHQALTKQFADRSLSRVYRALVWGVPSPLEGEVAGAIGRHPRARQKMAVVPRGGKEALTHYKVQEVFGNIASLVECRLATGRTHQIRVHMEHIKHPVVGDPVYGSRRRATSGAEKGLIALLEAFPRQALHAGEIKFVHPRTNKHMKYNANLPSDMAALLKRLRGAI